MEFWIVDLIPILPLGEITPPHGPLSGVIRNLATRELRHVTKPYYVHLARELHQFLVAAERDMAHFLCVAAQLGFAGPCVATAPL